MKAGWQAERLGDVCAFLNRGISPKYLEQGGICVLNQKCIRDHRVSYQQSRRHDSVAKSISAERYIQLGDVLVNSTGTGTLGRVAQVRDMPTEPTTVDSHVTIVRPKPGKFFQDFFGYMLIFIEESIKEAGEGCGGQTELARSVLAERFSVCYPASIDDQKRVVAILDEAFEGIATAKVNAEKNLQNARALFESHLQSVFSQRGEGWMEDALGNMCDFSQGIQVDVKLQSETKKNEAQIRFLRIVDFTQGNEPERYIDNPGEKFIVCTSDISLVRYGASTGFVCTALDGAIANNLFKVIPKKNSISKRYLYWFLKSAAFQGK